MFAEMEAGLLDMIKSSALKDRLAQLGTLPDMDGDNLIKRMASDAPAVYVVTGHPYAVADGTLGVPFGLACVAKNARGHEDARRGDGKAIGLYAMLEAVLGLADNGIAGGYTWRVTGVEFLSEDKLWQNGLTVGVVRVETSAAMPQGINASLLADFETFHAGYDIPPHELDAEHDKWAETPPDYSSSKPELAETVTVQS